MPRALQLPPNQCPLITDPFRHHHTYLCCMRARAHTHTAQHPFQALPSGDPCKWAEALGADVSNSHLASKF